MKNKFEIYYQKLATLDTFGAVYSERVEGFLQLT